MLRFAWPSWFAVALPALVLVLLGYRSLSNDLSKTRRHLALAVRVAAVLLLAAALASPSLPRTAERPRLTIFVEDVSASVPAGPVPEPVRELWNREVAAGRRCSWIRFAGTAAVTVPPGLSPLDLPPPDPALRLDRTDSGTGLRLARTLFERDADNRIVLLSDGQEDLPSEVPAGLVYVPLRRPGNAEIAVLDVEAPLAVRAGEPFDLRVVLHMAAAGDAQISLTLDDLPLPEAGRRVRLDAPGRHVVTLPNLQQRKAFPPGLHRLLVVAETPGDGERRNNVGAAAVAVTGKPQVLLVEGSSRDGDFLAGVLKAQDIDLVRRSPAELHEGVVGESVATILAGVGRDALPAGAAAALKAHVEQSGAGLWALGAPSQRGWALEALLPVEFIDATPAVRAPDPVPPSTPAPSPPDPESARPQRVLAPTLALLLLVDKSGSMAGTNIQIVKEACLAAARALSKRDLIGVLAFDQRPRWILDFTEAERFDVIQERVLRLLADGGTHIYPALAEAFRAFEQDGRARRCAVKHVVLLSDGDTPAADFETVVRAMAEGGITVSTVCVAAAKFDAILMGQIAAWGSGRFKFTSSFRNVPELIVNEAKRALTLLPKDAPPDPAPKATQPAPLPPPTPAPAPSPAPPAAPLPVHVVEAHEILGGLAGKALPHLKGLMESKARPKAIELLATEERKPVLALGRAGLGKTAVWTSDFGSDWSTEWRNFPEAPKLAAQLVRWVSGAGPEVELASRTRLLPAPGGALLRMDPEAGLSARTVETGQPLDFRPGPAGTLETLLRPPKPVDPLRVLLQRKDGKSLTIGAVRAYDDEFRPVEDRWRARSAGLETLAGPSVTTERRVDLSPWLALLAALLLPLDVGLRRWAR